MPQPVGKNGHNSEVAAGSEDGQETAPVHHQEGINNGENGINGANLSDEAYNPDSDVIVTEEEEYLDVESDSSTLEGATKEIEVIGVAKLGNNDNEENDNDDILRISQQASTLTPLRKNTFVQANF